MKQDKGQGTIRAYLGKSASFFYYKRLLLLLAVLVLLIIAFDLVYGRKFPTEARLRKAVLKMKEKDAIKDLPLLWKSLTILILVIAGFMAAEHLHIANGTIAMFGAMVMLLTYTFGNSHDERDHKVEDAFGLVDWTTIFFFAGLFAIVYGLEQAGVLTLLGNKFIDYTDGSIEKAAMLVVWISAFVSTAIDNIPFVATMIPMIKTMEAGMGGRELMMPVWWALSLGACFGGNGSLIAASANVIVAGMAQREGHPIHFMRFLIWSIPVMLGSVGVAALYLHIRHFM